MIKTIKNFFKTRKDFRQNWQTIQEEFVETREIFEWLYNNEFTPLKDYFEKIDLVDAYDFLRGRLPDDIENIVREDMIKSLDNVLSQSNFNLDDITTLTVNVDTMELPDERGHMGLHLVFIVRITAYDYYQFLSAKEKFIKLLKRIGIGLGVITGLCSIAYIGYKLWI